MTPNYENQTNFMKLYSYIPIFLFTLKGHLDTFGKATQWRYYVSKPFCIDKDLNDFQACATK